MTRYFLLILLTFAMSCGHVVYLRPSVCYLVNDRINTGEEYSWQFSGNIPWHCDVSCFAFNIPTYVIPRIDGNRVFQETCPDGETGLLLSRTTLGLFDGRHFFSAWLSIWGYQLVASDGGELGDDKFDYIVDKNIHSLTANAQLKPETEFHTYPVDDLSGLIIFSQDSGGPLPGLIIGVRSTPVQEGEHFAVLHIVTDVVSEALLDEMIYMLESVELLDGVSTSLAE